MPEIYIILFVSYASIKLREEKRIFYFCPRKITVCNYLQFREGTDQIPAFKFCFVGNFYNFF